MIHKEEKYCVYCSSADLVKNGKCPSGSQRWRCNSCKKGFRFDYRYNARKQGVRKKIIEMILYGSRVRDIGRVIKISKDTVWTMPLVRILKRSIIKQALMEISNRPICDITNLQSVFVLNSYLGISDVGYFIKKSIIIL